MRISSTWVTWQKLAFVCALLLLPVRVDAQGGTFVGIGALPGGSTSAAQGMSADGKIVVGFGTTANGPEPFRWTAATGIIESLNSVHGSSFLGYAKNASTNGVIVGSLQDHPAAGDTSAFYWTEEEGFVVSTDRNDGAMAVSDDGQIVVGLRGFWNDSLEFAPTLWPTPSGEFGQAFCVSANGQVAGGLYWKPGVALLPVLWDLSTGTPTVIEIMGVVANATTNVVYAISDDGSVVAGNITYDGEETQGFRWTSETGMVLLTLPGGELPSSQGIYPSGMNGDGTVIIGGGMYWSPSTDLIPMREFLVSQGLGPQLANWRDVAATGVSKDGRIFSGTGVHRGEDGIERQEGWYASLNSAPNADAGDDVDVNATGPLTAVRLDGTGSSDPDEDDLQFEWSVPAGSGATIDDPTSPTPLCHFPVGPTLVSLTVTDGYGGIDVDDVLVTVSADTTPPAVVCTTDLGVLWPPNHQMVAVQICIAASDNVTAPENLDLYCTISSNEPDDAKGDGKTAGDVDGRNGYTRPVNITNKFTYDPDKGCYFATVNLRAERDGAKTSRVYSIVCDVEDEEGNFATASCVVVVPHDKKK